MTDAFLWAAFESVGKWAADVNGEESAGREGDQLVEGWPSKHSMAMKCGHRAFDSVNRARPGD